MMSGSHVERLIADRTRMIAHLRTLSDGDAARPQWLNNLGNLSLALYDATGDPSHLDEAVVWHGAAWADSADGDPARAGYAANQATSHLQRFRRRNEEDDLTAARERILTALAITPDEHEHRLGRLHTLGNVLECLARERGDPADLDEAVRVRDEALAAPSRGIPSRAVLLTGAGNTVLLRYHTRYDPADLGAALAYHEQALAAAESDGPRAAARTNLSTCHADRFQLTGQPGDLAAGIEHAEEALRLTPEDAPERTARASNLASMLRSRYDRLGDSDDLDRAIELALKALSVPSAPGLTRAALLGNLGAALHTCHRHRGGSNVLEQAVTFLREAVRLVPRPGDDLARWKNNLGNALSSLYLRDMDLRHLDEAISHLRGAVELTPGPRHPHRAARLHNLAGSLHRRVGSTGDLTDLSEAINSYAAAAEAAPAGERLFAAANAGLGAALGLRFALRGNGEDLDAAIHRLGLALAAVSPTDPDRLTWLVNLAGQLIRRFQHTRQRAALDQAIELLALAANATAQDHPYLPLRLETYGRALAMRFEAYADPADGDAAVIQCERAERAARNPVDRGMALHVLGDVLQARYERAGESADDLRRAGEALEKAVRTLPAAHPDHALTLRSLGIAARFRAAARQDPRVADRAVRLLKRAAKGGSRLGRPDTVTLMELATAYRVRSGLPDDPERQQLNRIRSRRTGRDALRACREEVLLQPSTADGLAVTRRAARHAAAVISWCLEDEAVTEAVEAMETARGMVHRAAMFTGSAGDRLREAGHGDLAARWEAEQARALELRGASGRSGAADAPDVEPVPSQLRDEVVRVLTSEEQRAASGLGAAYSAGAVRAALAVASTDALVYLLPGTTRRSGYAVVLPREGVPRRLVLDGFRAVPGGKLSAYVETYNRLLVATAAEAEDGDDETDSQLGRQEVVDTWTTALHELCDWAWEAVMAPVLAAIRDLSPAHGDAPPRLVIVPTGHATLVPWHAARASTGNGGHRYAVEEAVIGYAASAQLFCETARRGRSAMDGRALIIGNPTFSLQFAEAETQQIHQLCYPAGRHIGPPRAAGDVRVTPDLVLSELSGPESAAFPVIHLACHGYAAADPARSRLALADRRPLTVERLLAHGRTSRRSDAGPLVVLSACASGMSTDDFDEMMTLATAFLIAGASAAVGSLWIVDDRNTADLMTTFHHVLASDRRDPLDALRAAQIEMIEAGRQAAPQPGRRSLGDPYCWAAFTHQGR
ncbi:CHAT domain-containing protein [Nonomuraea sp. NPDC048901]|uniref:CHAT domain-containing tetratricopeptide repeat protein n=1 Tax=Nonomuraea sp. NPDC048901 TaxID=3155627 RepID=UPI00340B3622